MSEKAQIDFYILETVAHERQSYYFACQLVEKLHTEQKRIYLYMNSRHQAERIDALLWTYRDHAFLPHNLYDTADDYPPPIQIGFEDTVPSQHGEILINFAQQIPAFYKQFKHIIEIVFNDPHVQQLARDRYKQYRHQQHEINTHKIKALLP